MATIGREKYHKAASMIFRSTGFDIQEINLCKLLVINNDNRLFVDISGRNLPYYIILPGFETSV